MAFVGSQFKHDVFVSYSHGDTAGTGDGALGQWSQSFIRELEREMRFLPDAGMTSVFLDQHSRAGQSLDPSMGLAAALKGDINAAAVMLVLMSEHYLRSEWCRHERAWWGETKDVHKLDPWNRVSFARLLPVNNEFWPREFCDETGQPPVGHALYNHSDEFPRPLDWPEVDRTSREVRPAMIKLAGELRRKLEAIRKELEQRQLQAQAQLSLSAPSGQMVYLHGRESDSSDWFQVRARLMDSDFAVLPFDPEPIESDPKVRQRITDDRVAAMSTCDAVLLLGTEDRSALTADLAVVGRFDRQQAIARSNRPLPCSVVDTRGVVTRRPEWQVVAKSVGVQWLNASLEQLPVRLRGWLAQAAA